LRLIRLDMITPCKDQDLIDWTSTQIQLFLPYLDPSALHDAVTYSLSLPPQDTDRHWRSLLGSSPQVDTFLSLLREKSSPPNHLPRSPPQSVSGSSVSSRTRQTPPKVLRITKHGPGKLTSDLGKRKPKPSSQTIVSRAAKENRPLSELEEIDSAIESISHPVKRTTVCGCFGTIHDVFPLAPNCTSCGRIICVQEGIGPCPFCGVQLISEDQREVVLKELKLERGIAKTKLANEKVRKVKAGDSRQRIWASKAGGQEHSHSDSEAYLLAQQKRDELLHFDKTSAERTRIIGPVLVWGALT
jgi:Putative zinc finger motif, C2HC5-type